MIWQQMTIKTLKPLPDEISVMKLDTENVLSWTVFSWERCMATVKWTLVMVWLFFVLSIQVLYMPFHHHFCYAKEEDCLSKLFKTTSPSVDLLPPSQERKANSQGRRNAEGEAPALTLWPLAVEHLAVRPCWKQQMLRSEGKGLLV